MNTIMPQNELLRRAVAYVLATQKEFPTRPLAHIIDAAGMQFNLSPLECESLSRLLQNQEK